MKKTKQKNSKIHPIIGSQSIETNPEITDGLNRQEG